MPVFAREEKVLGIARSRWPSIIAPIVIGILALAFWEWIVWYKDIKPYVLPGPVTIAKALVNDWARCPARCGSRCASPLRRWWRRSW